MMRRWVVAAVLACAASTDADAHADDKAACLEAASNGQTLRDARKLVEARQQFRLCAAQGCPAVVQKECDAWLAEVERGLPTVVITAKDGAGADLFEVKVSVDGMPLTTKLDGGAVPVNPGPHALHFELADGTTLDQQVLVREGAKDQSVAVVLRPAAPVTPPPPPVLQPPAPVPSLPVPVASPPPSGGKSTLFWAGVMTAGAGAAAGLVFGGLAMGKAGSLSGECANHVCTSSGAQSDYYSAKTLALVSDIGFGVAGVGAALAIVGFFTSGPSRAEAPSVSLWVGAGTAGVGGTFR